MQKKYIVRLSEEEQDFLQDIVKKLKGTSQKVRRANILLKANINGPNWNDAKIAEPLSGWRKVSSRPKRKKTDWALEMEELLRTRYADAEKVNVVCDNLNTHTRGAFYNTFDPETARKLVRKIEFHYTPKHGSWLNIAENELSSMTRQSISGRRIENIEMLRTETAAWADASNEKQRGIDWQFTIEKARIKLKSLYPNL